MKVYVVLTFLTVLLACDASQRRPVPNALGNPFTGITRERLAIVDEQVQRGEERLARAERELADVIAAALREGLAAGSRDLIHTPQWTRRIARAERDVRIAESLLRALSATRHQEEIALAWAMYGDALREHGPSPLPVDSARNP